MDTVKFKKGNTLAVAHRGVCGLEISALPVFSFDFLCTKDYGQLLHLLIIIWGLFVPELFLVLLFSL